MDQRITPNAAISSSPADIASGLPPLAKDPTLPLPNIRAAEPTFMEVFFAWEKLRLLYNGLLILAVLIRFQFILEVIPFFVEPAIYANLCFCAGPVAEGYLCWLGLAHQPCRWVVFWIGFFFTLAFAIVYSPFPEWP
jgi:hypothetical protein